VKTRVLKEYDWRNAVDVFHVQKWALWDDQELRRYHPNDYKWRHVKTLRTEEEAKDLAYRLSSGCSIEQVVAEYGTE
jgi:hypothetical protein